MIRLLHGRKAPNGASARIFQAINLSIWLVCLVLAGCDLSDASGVTLTIESPENGSQLSNQDDVDRAADGVQIAVRVRTEGVGNGTLLELYRLREGQPVGTMALASVQDGEATFEAFTLQPGLNELQARVQGAQRVSPVVSVSLDNRCGSIEFVEPARVADSVIRLGPIDDRDAEACGDTFTTRVVASTGLSDGTEVSLLVNGSASRTTTTAGGVATFDEVVLGNRGETPNRLALEIVGTSCPPVELNTNVFVDCVGPSCSLGGPMGTELSSAEDEDPGSAGLQLSLDVMSDAENENVRLLINGDVDNAKTAETKKGTASFTKISLPEGKGVRVKAVCSGENGATSTSERLFNVDTTACAIAITKPSTAEIFRAEQASKDEPPATSLNIDVLASVGSDCVSFRAVAGTLSDCSGIEQVMATQLKAGQTAIDTEVTLANQGAQHVCVQVADGAGNTSTMAVSVTFDRQTPNLTIIEPASDLSINRLGNAGRVADQNLDTPACERPIRVSCSETGAQVQIVTQPEGVVLTTALCTAGFADFASVALPTKNDGTSYEIIARSTGNNGLTGSSSPRVIEADCQVQTLAFADLTCGVSAIRSSDDTDPVLSGIQRDVLLENTPVPRPIATLTIDGLPVPADPLDLEEGVSIFRDLTFTLNTTPTLKACATDAAGNTGCTPDCTVIVGDVPSVAITTPSTSSVLTRDLSVSGVSYLKGPPVSSDCAPGTPGLQIEVKASTDAPDGRAARIALLASSAPGAAEVASLDSTVSAGEVSGCIETADGDDLLLRVEVEHSNAAVYGVATRSVRIDGNAPSAAITLASQAPDCRVTSLSFAEGTDTAALGVTRKLVGYERRCADSAINSEAAWDAATPVNSTLSVVNPSADSIEYRFRVLSRPGRSRFCSVRGYDAAYALTPLAGSFELAAQPFNERVIALSCIDNGDRCVPMADGVLGAASSGTRASAVGDVNGDGFDDVLIAGGAADSPGTAALYLGSNTGLSTTPIVRFVSSDTLPGMGQTAAGLGDFNDDGYDDFALSGQAMRIAFVVFGRPDGAWPTRPVIVDNGACATDLCIAHDLGASAGLAAAGDFDDDGVSDLTLSAPSSVVSVVRGGRNYRLNSALGGTDTGVCLDARTLRSGPSSTLTCNSASTPSGFHIYTPLAPHQVQALGERLYISHRGVPNNARVWAVSTRPYTAGTGMQAIGSSNDFAHLTLVHDLAQTANGLFDRALSAVGDFDGDGRLDLVAGIDRSEGQLYVYPGQADGSVAFTSGAPSSQVGYVIRNTQVDSANDAFGDDVALGYHPVFGLLGDLDGDGLGDILTSSRQDGADIGSVDVFYGSTDRSLLRDRSDRDFAFDDATLIHPADGPIPYVRRGEYIGDVDGDGHNDLAITEESFSAQGQYGRVIIVGQCKGP